MPRSLDAFHDSDRVLRLAAETFFDHLSEMCEGILVVDKSARVVWVNDRWQRNMASLGFSTTDQIIGRPVEEIVPNTLMRQVVETGKPILLDVLENKAGTYLVSRFPLHDDSGAVIGAVGLILYDQIESLKPLIGKMGRLQSELAQAQKELARQRRTRYTFSNFVGNSERALEVKSRARRAAVLSTTVLLLGETGTGKELVAQAIHAASQRARHPFIAVNVAAIPDTLLEAEFFGVAPGAYTGADRRGRDGKFKLADGGTLFLDEIGDMPMALQSKLLRVLQEREVERLGSNDVSRVDVRVIAASSVDLANAGGRRALPQRPVLPAQRAADPAAAAARAARGPGGAVRAPARTAGARAGDAAEGDRPRRARGARGAAVAGQRARAAQRARARLLAVGRHAADHGGVQGGAAGDRCGGGARAVRRARGADAGERARPQRDERQSG